jgi:hypothetical protein
MINTTYRKIGGLFAFLCCVNNPFIAASAKPVVIEQGVTFDFKGCSTVASSSGGKDIVCIGDFLSRSGEKSISLQAQTSNPYAHKGTTINDSAGKTYYANEIKIGDNWSCRVDCPNITLVEGVKYSASFVFQDVSVLSSKIPLFAIDIPTGFPSFFNEDKRIKFRNINLRS